MPSGPIKRLDHEVPDWRKSHDREWRVYADTRTLCGKLLGGKFIDNKQHFVVKVKNRYWAALPTSVVKPK